MTVARPDPILPLITGIVPRSAAAAAGLRAATYPTIDASHAALTNCVAKVAAAEGKPVLLSVWREGAGVADCWPRASRTCRPPPAMKALADRRHRRRHLFLTWRPAPPV